MSEENDDLKSIKVYKFKKTKESRHEFTLKFRVIADDRGYDDIIEGIVTPPEETEDLEILEEDNAAVKKSKKEKQLAKAANKKGFRDLVMSTEGISLNIVENSTSDKLMREDLKNTWGRLERHWNPRLEKIRFNSTPSSCTTSLRLSNRAQWIGWHSWRRKEMNWQIQGI